MKWIIMVRGVPTLEGRSILELGNHRKAKVIMNSGDHRKA